MKIIAVIPARYAASRFPAKLLQNLAGKSIIRHTYDNTVATGLFEEVIVATDHALIFNEIIAHGGTAVMSQKQHDSGSDRIAEAVENLSCDIVVNVQGDEPFIQQETLQALLQALLNDTEQAIQVASLMHTIYITEDINNPNYVKVVVDKYLHALYFSRAPIPYVRSPAENLIFYKHIGVYAFRKNALLAFTRLQPSILENTEKLEQLRYLENGMNIKMVLTERATLGIDTPEDLEKAKSLLNK